VLGRIFRWGGSDAYARGIAAYNAGQLEEALDAFDEVLERHSDPSHPDVTLASFYQAEAHRRLAEQCIDSGDFSRALHHLDLAVEGQPDYPDLHLRRGVMQLELDDAVTARESARRALERNAGFVEAGLLHALALDALGERARSDEERRTWGERARAEGHPLAECFARDGSGRSVLLEHLRGVHRRRERAAMAESYQRQGLHSEARRLLLQLVEENPGYPDLRVRLATAEFALGSADRARSHVKAALEVHPAFEEARLLEAVLDLWAGNMAATPDGLQPLLDSPRVGASARYVLAVRQLVVGRPQAARDLLRSVVAPDGRTESLAVLDAAIEAMLGHHERCRAHYVELLQPGVGETALLDAMAYAIEREDLELARRGREFLESNGDDPVNWVARALVHRLEGDGETAVDLLESASSRHPGHAALLFMLAQLYADRGETQAAARRLVGLEVSNRVAEESRVLHARCLRHDDEAGEALRLLEGGDQEEIPGRDRARELLFALRLLQRGNEATQLWQARAEFFPLDHGWRILAVRRWLLPLVVRGGDVEEPSSTSRELAPH
jgi:tetratricopeptide (TPR) repeat protein